MCISYSKCGSFEKFISLLIALLVNSVLARLCSVLRTDLTVSAGWDSSTGLRQDLFSNLQVVGRTQFAVVVGLRSRLLLAVSRGATLSFWRPCVPPHLVSASFKPAAVPCALNLHLLPPAGENTHCF